MNFEDFIKKGDVRRSVFDAGLIKSLLETAEIDLQFFDSLKITEISARKILSNYYDVLRAILEALALKKGYKIYSHEAITYFLQFINEPVISDKFEKLRKIRNGINYYGNSVSVSEAKDRISEIKFLIKSLKKLI